MYILDIKLMHSKCGRTALTYAGATVFCVIFSWIYEIFSYGEHSDFMRHMYLAPLLGGVVIFGAMYLLKADRMISRFAFNMWNSGIALITSGCLIRGITEISGRASEYDAIYWILGGIAMSVGFIAECVSIQKNSLKLQITFTKIK